MATKRKPRKPVKKPQVEPLPEYKEKLKELARELNQRLGINSIIAELTEEQKKAASEVAAKGEQIKGMFERPSLEEIRQVVREAVHREVEILGQELKPQQESTLDQILFSLVTGILGSQIYDLLRVLIPYLQNIFMAARPTEQMRKAQQWADETTAVLPSDMGNFLDEHYQGLLAVRAQAWNELQERIEKSELASVISTPMVRDLAQILESRLIRPR